MRKVYLSVGGVMALLFTLSHLSFWILFNWSEELARLSPVNGGVMQMLNVVSIYLFLFVAGFSFYLTRKSELRTPEKIIVIFFTGIFVLRIVFGTVFFEFTTREVVIKGLCLLTAVCYSLSLIPYQREAA